MAALGPSRPRRSRGLLGPLCLLLATCLVAGDDAPSGCRKRNGFCVSKDACTKKEGQYIDEDAKEGDLCMDGKACCLDYNTVVPGDEPCTEGKPFLEIMPGKCQDSDTPCMNHGKYATSDKCGGPADRKCCAPESDGAKKKRLRKAKKKLKALAGLKGKPSAKGPGGKGSGAKAPVGPGGKKTGFAAMTISGLKEHVKELGATDEQMKKCDTKDDWIAMARSLGSTVEEEAAEAAAEADNKKDAATAGKASASATGSGSDEDEGSGSGSDDEEGQDPAVKARMDAGMAYLASAKKDRKGGECQETTPKASCSLDDDCVLACKNAAVLDMNPSCKLTHCHCSGRCLAKKPALFVKLESLADAGGTGGIGADMAANALKKGKENLKTSLIKLVSKPQAEMSMHCVGAWATYVWHRKSQFQPCLLCLT